MKLSAVVITLNEEKNIADCLETLKFADEIIVVDSESSDQTREIARRFTPKVSVRKFDDFSSQKNFAVSQAKGDWVLSVDADERVPQALAAEIKEILSRSDVEDAYRVHRRTRIFGRDFKFSGLQNDAPVRLFRKNKALFIKLVHEIVDVRGTTGVLKNFLEHRSFQTIAEHQRRLELYTSLEPLPAGERRDPGWADYCLRPLRRFFLIYVKGQGFRDGSQGFLYAWLSARYELERWKKAAKAMSTPAENSKERSWGDFYEGAGGKEYFAQHTAIHKDFLKEVLDRKPARLMEAGCGSAIMSIFFSMAGVDVTACDREEDVLKKAQETARVWKAKVRFEKQDIFRLKFPADHFDAVFSQGVLEHMSDDEMRAACKEALRVAPVFLFSVPSHYYKHKDFGNERLLKEKDWKRILEGVGSLQLEPYFKTRVKRNFLIKRPLMLMGILSR